jgi:HD superfamily phosphohydrolase
MKELTHRDEIHGDVDYDPLAVALLNTSPLQRLGRVYQLGYGHLVYRGGNHTRLSHSMGTYATAGRLVDALRHNYESRSRPPRGALDQDRFLPRGPKRNARAGERQELTLDVAPPGPAPATDLPDRWTVLRHLVCWAALLHDIGHVPLGHTLEDEFEGIYQRHDEFSSPRLKHLWFGDGTDMNAEIRAVLLRSELYPEAFHRLRIVRGEDVWACVLLICTWKEKITDGRRTTFLEILRSDIDGRKASGSDPAVAVRLAEEIERLSPWLFAPYMADIVANTISADYLDYLRRDPHNLGLDVLKDDRVVSRFWIGADHRGQSRMALSLVDRRGKPRLDTCTGVVELVRQRYRFAEIVYYHKTKVAASAMLAKVFHLIGTPKEIPSARDRPGLGDAPQIVNDLLVKRGAARARRMAQLQVDCMPVALLDPEVGDESLGMLLRQRAWQQLERSIQAGSREGATRAVQSITLLDALARRELYKVCFSMNARQFRSISGSTEDTPREEVERCLGEFLKPLRKDPQVRANAEAAMVGRATGWPEGSLLLYVPPRKSQAKGIQTGALADGRVVIEESCWFRYIRHDLRVAARRFGRLSAFSGADQVDWSKLTEFDGLVRGRPADEELAVGAALLRELASRTNLATARGQLAQFDRPGALQAASSSFEQTSSPRPRARERPTVTPSSGTPGSL